MPRPIVPAPITAIVFTSIASPRKKVLRHREHRCTETTKKELLTFPLPRYFPAPSTSRHNGCAGLLHGCAARLIANPKQTPGRLPRHLLRRRGRGERRQNLAAGPVMALFVRIDYFAVELRDFLLPGGFEKLQKLRVAPPAHSFACNERRGDALDGGVQRAQVSEHGARRLEWIEAIERHAQCAHFFGEQLVVARLVAGVAGERQPGVELWRRIYPRGGNHCGLHLILERDFQERDNGGHGPAGRAR